MIGAQPLVFKKLIETNEEQNYFPIPNFFHVIYYLYIKVICEEELESIKNIKIIDLRENKITSLPQNIDVLSQLERLDVSR